MAQKKKTVEFFKQTKPVKKAVKKVETDEILDGVDKFEYLLAQYWKPVAVGAAALAVIVVALIIIQAVRANADRELRNTFASAVTIPALENVIAENGKHPAAYDARIRLAQLCAANKEYGKAYAAMNDAAAMREIDPYLCIKAGIQSAYQLENDQKDAAAVQTFTNYANDPNSTETQRMESAYGAARLSAKLGKKEDALRFLNTVSVPANNTAAGYWQQRCAELKKQLEK